MCVSVCVCVECMCSVCMSDIIQCICNMLVVLDVIHLHDDRNSRLNIEVKLLKKDEGQDDNFGKEA